jgi:hypothetical protein
VSIAPNGEVWASWRNESDGGVKWRVGHLGPTGWESIDGFSPFEFSDGGFDRFYITDDGDRYAAYTESLYRHDDGAWSAVSSLDGWGFPVVDVGRDGTIWQSGGMTLFGDVADDTPFAGQGLTPESEAFHAYPEGLFSILSEGLARFAGGEWAAWTSADLPDIDLPTRLGDAEFKVAPDGSLWVGSHCDGLARFDGESLDRFLPGQCISMDIAADGSVWVLAHEGEGKDLYVITPEAVAGTQ